MIFCINNIMTTVSMEEYTSLSESRNDYLIKEMREVIKERVSLCDILKNTPTLKEFAG